MATPSAATTVLKCFKNVRIERVIILKYCAAANGDKVRVDCERARIEHLFTSHCTWDNKVMIQTDLNTLFIAAFSSDCRLAPAIGETQRPFFFAPGATVVAFCATPTAAHCMSGKSCNSIIATSELLISGVRLSCSLPS